MLKTQQLEGAGNPLRDQIEHFGKVIRGEEPPRTSGEDGARTLSTTLAIIKAASKKQIVSPNIIQ
jgi:predicted dehydrogenase